MVVVDHQRPPIHRFESAEERVSGSVDAKCLRRISLVVPYIRLAHQLNALLIVHHESVKTLLRVSCCWKEIFTRGAREDLPLWRMKLLDTWESRTVYIEPPEDEVAEE